MSKYWMYVTDIESENEPGKSYAIKRHITSARLGCDCLSYRFAKGANKSCKHIRAYLNINAEVWDQPKTQPVVKHVVVAGETFKVTRRAISFGPVRAPSR